MVDVCISVFSGDVLSDMEETDSWLGFQLLVFVLISKAKCNGIVQHSTIFIVKLRENDVHPDNTQSSVIVSNNARYSLVICPPVKGRSLRAFLGQHLSFIKV